MKNLKDVPLSMKLGLFLVALAGLLLLNFCSILYFMSVRNDNTHAIDITGYNRMLTQRVAYLSERVARGHDVRKDLRVAHYSAGRIVRKTSHRRRIHAGIRKPHLYHTTPHHGTT